MTRPATPARRAGLALILLAVAAGSPPAARAVSPADPLFPQQWQLTHSAVMGFPMAWDLAPADPVTVAVIDSGVAFTHPDLRGRLWTNRSEIPANGIDDDHDGYVDDIHGYDFADDRPAPDRGFDHGTLVAGVIAAVHNDVGIAGVAPNARVMALTTMHDDGEAPQGALGAAIDYATEYGARIVNLSIADGDRRDAVEAALRRAAAAGVLAVVAAGNDGANLDVHASYPASYTEPNILTVAASEPSGGTAPFSNFGPQTVPLAAPGTNALSTAADGGYEVVDGTSFAAPQVAGVAALLAAIDPSARAPRLIAALEAGARHGDGRVRYGRLDAVGAIRALEAGWQRPDPTLMTVAWPQPARQRAARRRRNARRAAPGRSRRRASTGG